MAKAASQPNMMVYMVAVPYGSDGQQQPQQWMTDQSHYGNQFGGGQVLVPMQPDGRGGQAMPVQQMPDQTGQQPWTQGSWQEMPQQSQQWSGGWTDQSQGGQMPPQAQQQEQQPWTNPMANNNGMMQQGHQNLGMQAAGQQQHQPQQFNMPQQQQQFHLQQQSAAAQQQFFLPQQFQQGNMQNQQPQQQTPQQQMPTQQTTQQPQFTPQQQTSPTEPAPSAHSSPAPVNASLSAKPKKKGLVNKAIVKESTPEEPTPTPAPAPVSSAPTPTPAPAPASAAATPQPTEQRARKGLVNKPISKDTPADPPAPAEEPPAPAPAPAEQPKPAKKGLVNKPIAKEPVGEPKKEAVEEAPAPSTSSAPATSSPAPAPTAPETKEKLDMKAIAAWEPSKASESDNKSMIKALGLEPVNPTRPKPRPAVPEKTRTEDTIEGLKTFAAEQKQKTTPTPTPTPTTTTTAAAGEKPKGFRLKNATLTPQGGIKEVVPAPKEEPKPVAKVEEVKSSPAAPSKMPEPPKDATPKASGAVLLGREGFSRTVMLQFWKVIKDSPITDLGYHTAARDEDACSPGEMWRNPRKNSLQADKTPSWRRDGKNSAKSAREVRERIDESLTNRSANPYKKKTAANREEGLTREVRALLNKICPENKAKIIRKLGEINVDNSEELEIVIGIIFHKVTDDPHHCETYADMVRNMSEIYNEKVFPQEENQTLDFRRMLVNQCQNKFEDLLNNTDLIVTKPEGMEQEEYDDLVIRQKRCAMATMKFIGYLYLRKLIAAAVIRTVVKELLNGTQENPDSPPELQVEYALELIQTTGHEFDKTDKDKAHLGVFFGRLNDLKKFKKPDGKPCLSKRLQFQIQDLVDMRNAGWAKSKHKEVAKTKAEVAEEQDRDEAQDAHNSKAGKGGGKSRKNHF